MLKAKVRIEGYVDGERTVFQPGEEVVGLHKHDIDELKKSGALEDDAETAREERTAAAADRAASKDFEQAREKVQAQQESTAAGAPDPAVSEKEPAGKPGNSRKK